MRKALNSNKNLTTHEGGKFNGIELLTSYEFISEYLYSTENVLGLALNEHKRTLVIRFDLHFPKQTDCPDYPSPYQSNVISRFIASLQAKFKADLKKKRRDNVRVHHSTMRYIWCKQRKWANQPHYHVALLLNGDTYNSIGLYGSQYHNNSARINQAWLSTLGLEIHSVAGLVHFPSSRPLYYLDVNSALFETVYNDVFRRLSYLCKSASKEYSNTGNSFCCSRK